MMVTFTDSQVGEILKRLDRVQENAIAIDEERVYWKDVAEKRYAENQELRHQLADNYFQSQQSLKREVERLANRLKSTEEELAMTQKALVNSIEIIDEKNREIERLKQVAHQNAVAADGFAREVAAWKEREAYQAQQRDILYQENVALREAAETNEVAIVALGDILRGILRNLRSMSEDYNHHRGRFGGTGVASEIDSILNGDGYTKAEV